MWHGRALAVYTSMEWCASVVCLSMLKESRDMSEHEPIYTISQSEVVVESSKNHVSNNTNLLHMSTFP